jgi:hypothetical protein
MKKLPYFFSSWASKKKVIGVLIHEAGRAICGGAQSISGSVCVGREEAMPSQ